MAGQRLALLIAADEFADPGLARLRAPQVDVEALAGVFEDPDIGGFTVERLVNGTSQELRLAVNRVFAQRDPDDFVLVHVSSHGLKDATGELFLATADTRREQLDATSVEATYLRRQMDRSRARAAVLLLDCCYGGAFERGMVSRSDGSVDLSHAFVAENEGRGRAVITASTAIEYAFEGAELTADQPVAASVFSDAIVTGLRQGAADLDGDGLVSLGELFTFVSRRVREQRAGQTPQWWLYGMSEELVIARNPNPAIKALDLPADVRDVLAFPQAAARLGAVLALRDLLDGEPGLALTAYETLQTLALDDSRQVSTAASAALSDVHVAAEPAVLDFGRVAAGAPVPTLDLRLSGSLAGACQLVSLDAPVTVSRRGDQARISLDTATTGVVDGQLEVRGPGGGATVAVRARIGTASPAHRSMGLPRPRLDPLLVSGWVLAGLVAVLGLVPLSSDSGWDFEDTWFGTIKTFLPIVAIPIPMLGVQLSRSRPALVACAGGLAGAGIPPAFALILTMNGGLSSWILVILLMVCVAVTVLGGLLVGRFLRGLPRGPAQLAPLGVVVTVAMGAWSAYLVRLTLQNGDTTYVGDLVLCGLLLLTFLTPLPAGVRVLLCGFALGAGLSAVLYLSPLLNSSQPAAEAAGLMDLALVVAALVNLWPAWRALGGLPVRDDAPVRSR